MISSFSSRGLDAVSKHLRTYISEARGVILALHVMVDSVESG